ncbi:hypothetical protein HB364_26165 [Pseudoflavitalea sp. X16]|uniref:hypothetical protein n=1 Tax=Paraflavitalea devenefica TaxID=2716334 RepID=UPI001422A803|nr:hypothetical protein [Paraflavitalea devenefica]NII28596.1 hypothetical protein [Paraflavitalea devenefica]
MHKLLPACMAFLLALTACQTRDNTDVIKAIDNSLIKANEIIAANNEIVHDDLAAKLKDPQTKAKASIWMPRALAVNALSKEIYKYIDNLKLQLAAIKEDDKAGIQELFRKEGDSLYNKLVRYNKDIVQVLSPEAFSDNPMLEAQLKKDIESFKKDIAARSGILDSVPEQPLHNQNWGKTYLHPSSLSLGTALLNKMQSDVLVTENNMVNHINRQIPYAWGYHYEVFHAIAALSSSYVKAGQVIEVTAGIGAFSAASKPTITINGSAMNANEDGVAVYNLKTNQKPGKYAVPVSIQYTRPDGSIEKVAKSLEYIIAE